MSDCLMMVVVSVHLSACPRVRLSTCPLPLVRLSACPLVRFLVVDCRLLVVGRFALLFSVAVKCAVFAVESAVSPSVRRVVRSLGRQFVRSYYFESLLVRQPAKTHRQTTNRLRLSRGLTN